MPDMVHRNNRDYKNFLSGNYYHLYNRGNNKQHIFIDDEDKKVFLFFLAEGVFPGRNKTKTKRPRRLLPPGSFDVHAYCIMPNHYHLLVKQHADISIARLIQKVCTSYVKYFNKLRILKSQVSKKLFTLNIALLVNVSLYNLDIV